MGWGEPDERPTIDVGAEINDQVRLAINAIRKHPRIYRRGPDLVVVRRGVPPRGGVLSDVWDHDPDSPMSRSATAPTIRPLDAAALAPMTADAVRFIKQGKRGVVDTFPPERVIHGMLRAVDTNERGFHAIRPILGALECPAFMYDGEILSEPGYDRKHHYELVASGNWIPVAHAPTQDDARAALERLLYPVADFPHLDESERGEALCGSHRAVWVAAVLTLLGRAAIPGSVPCFFFDASIRRSGKTLQCDLASIIARGGPAARASWPKEEVELDKVLAAIALQGDPVVCFDNVAHPWGGAPLDRVLTSSLNGTCPFRPLGRTEWVDIPWVSVIMGSGNNVVMTGDTIGRTILSRIETPHESPETRKDFRIPGGADALRKWALDHRAPLVHAALTILRAWHCAGRPKLAQRIGGFESWCDTVASAIIFAGGADVTTRFGALDGGVIDTAAQAAQTVVEFWPTVEAWVEHDDRNARPSGKGIRLKDLVEKLYPSDQRGEMGPDQKGFEPLREALESIKDFRKGNLPPDLGVFGNWMRGIKGQVRNGYKVVPVGKPTRWTAQPVKRPGES